ncbi:gypsy retrotransposon integrase-like protein 1 [Trichonephila clavipes]|nr:gypsy retrotransposon integrase-like protein 1 [Trichonephila clavipes]
MYKDTKNFVRSCTICLSRKNAFKIPPAPRKPVEQRQEPGETCHIDIFGPLKTTPKGNSYVFSMIDAFTKYIHIVPLPDIKSSTISKAVFDNYLVHRGYPLPHKLVVDNATYFKGSEFLEICRVMGIQKSHISNCSAHVNGRVEKPNQSLVTILASITHNTNDWDEQLPHTMLTLNSAIHEATYTSLFFLEHGRDIRLSYTYQKNSDTPQNKYEYVEKLLTQPASDKFNLLELIPTYEGSESLRIRRFLSKINDLAELGKWSNHSGNFFHKNLTYFFYMKQMEGWLEVDQSQVEVAQSLLGARKLSPVHGTNSKKVVLSQGRSAKVATEHQHLHRIANCS